MIKAVIFDMDGVLIESEINYINRFKQIIEKHGIKYDENQLFSIIGTDDSVTKQIFDEMCQGKLSGEDIYRYYDESLIENPLSYLEIRTVHALECMQQLKAEGYFVALASSTAREGIEKAMREAQLMPYIDVYFSGKDCERSKPFPDVYLKTMKHLGVEASECVVVEDSYYGIAAAKASGAICIARKDMYFNIDQSAADYSVEDLCDILNVVQKINHG